MVIDLHIKREKDFEATKGTGDSVRYKNEATGEMTISPRGQHRDDSS